MSKVVSLFDEAISSSKAAQDEAVEDFRLASEAQTRAYQDARIAAAGRSSALIRLVALGNSFTEVAALTGLTKVRVQQLVARGRVERGLKGRGDTNA